MLCYFLIFNKPFTFACSEIISVASSRPEVFFKTDILKHFTKFPGSHPWWSGFLAKIKKSIYSHGYFLGNFLKVFRTVLLTLTGDCFRGTKIRHDSFPT